MWKSSLRARLARSLPDRRAARLVARRRFDSTSMAMTTIGAAITELEQVLERHSAATLIEPDSLAANELRAAVRAIAAEARADDPVRCERMLLALRCAWRDFPEVRRIADQPIRDALWDRLVRLSCEEFYDPRKQLAVVA
jgi:hypothetical protein